MLGRVAGFVSKLAGPKALIGVVVTLVIVLGFLATRWQAAAEDAAGAEERAVQYRQALAQAEVELMAEREAQRALSEALEERREREEQARERAEQAEAALQKLERDNEQVAKWSDADLPDGVVGWLRDDHGASDADEGRAGGAAE